MVKFIEDALNSVDEIMSELLNTQKQTLKGGKKSELQIIIEQIKNKPTCSMSTQSTHSDTTNQVETQTSLAEIRNISTQTDCNDRNENKFTVINEDNMDNNIKDITQIRFAFKSTQCNLKKPSNKRKVKTSTKNCLKIKINSKKNPKEH
ncbi:hypothetical protein JTB14_004517 [Gonioctena quinquepunctata]|nr:hypothetical protein JTB14_004517 [Gonioctena quinquepunctata]